MKIPALFLILLSCLFVASCAATRPPTTTELIKEKNYTEAENNLHGAVMNLRFDPERALLLGVVYQKTGRAPLAKRIYLDILEQTPDTIVVTDLYPGFDQRPVGALAKYLIAQIDDQNKPQQSSPATRRQTFGQIAAATNTRKKTPLTGNPRVSSPSADRAQANAQESVQKSGTPGKYYGAHLASYKRALNIEPAANQYRSAFPDLFSDKKFLTRRLDLGKKGVFHRLIVGPYPTRKQAEDVCKEVKKKQSFCAVVRY